MFNNVEKYYTAGQATEDDTAHDIARWMPNATNTHPEYVILIAFPQQQWLHEHASVLRYTYCACLVYFYFCNPSSEFDIYFERVGQSVTDRF
jgi:hypothetical protein